MRKERLLRIEAVLDGSPDMPLDAQRDLLLKTLESHTQPSTRPQSQGVLRRLYSAAASYISGNTSSNDLNDQTPGVKDDDFLAILPSITDRFPVLIEVATEVVTMAREYFSSHINKEVHRAVRNIEDRRRSECKQSLKAQCERNMKQALDQSRSSFLHGIKDHFLRNHDR